MAMVLHDFVAEAALTYPDRVAIDVPPSSDSPQRQMVTYKELDEATSTWARMLCTHLQPEDIVAILLPRNTPLLYQAQLSALKAGAAYTCLEPSFPSERIQFILQDAGVKHILTSREHREQLEQELSASEEFQWWELDAELSFPEPDPNASLPEVQPEQLAYVIYTSGTTGKPKGVLIEHRSIVNLVLTDRDTFQLHPDDRVGQSSSAAYDSSIEETYLAFGAGASLVVMNDDVVRLGPDLIPWLQNERVSVLCPPPTLLRTTLCEDPEQELPLLRLLYVGGEALTPDIADKWAQGRWMENGYGPTECTVTVVRGRVWPQQPITIGTPVSGHQEWILNDKLELVASGQPGELCISGVGVARGYLNRPELTKQKFVEHPIAGRIYRTGDLVQQTEEGSLLYLGRIDTQVKIRGYRVELESIESHICEWSGVETAACSVQGEGASQQLVAFVVLKEGELLQWESLRNVLQEKLPSYMVPARFVVLDELPLSPTSGKIDRKSLPTVSWEVERTGELVTARNPLEQKLTERIKARLSFAGDVSIYDDFFTLGGNSVLAAQLISDFRLEPDTDSLTVRDIYDYPTVAALAQCLVQRRDNSEQNSGLEASQVVFSNHDELKVDEKAYPLLVSFLQFLWNATFLVFGAWATYFLGFIVFPNVLRVCGVLPFLFLLPIFFLFVGALYLPMSVALAVAIKGLLIGKYKPGRYPVWGSFFFRNWILTRLMRWIPWGWVEGTVFKNVFLRMLGAKIGNDVHIHNGVALAGGLDLLTLGDNVTIGRDAALRLIDLQDGELVVGPITVGDDATLETRAGLSPFSNVEEGGYLTSLSMMPAYATLPANEKWDGVPAQPVGPSPEAPSLTRDSSWTSVRHGVMMMLARWLAATAMGLPILLVMVGMSLWEFDAEAILAWLLSSTRYEILVVGVLLVSVVLGFMTFLVMQALVVRWIKPIQPGVYSRWSPEHIRAWLKNHYLESAGNTLSGSMFWPSWLRLAGMNIGPNCEVSSIMEVTPELVSIGKESFFADGIYLNPACFHRGTITYAPTTIGSNSFLGNHAVLPAGTDLPNKILLGVCTVADSEKMAEGTSWFGHPSFALPQREIVEVDESLTFKPSWIRWLNRFFWEFARFFLGILPLSVALLWFKTLPLWFSLSWPIFWGLVLPAYALGTYLFFCGFVFALKWFLLGKTEPGQHPLWSCWCSRWDFLYVAWRVYATPLVSIWEQSLWLAWWLRAMGVKVGKRVVLGDGFAQVVDPDMLHFEDGATVACQFQAHSFEDRVLKLDHVHLRKHSTTTAGCVVMYGADIGEHAHVEPHSVVMKQEVLLKDKVYCGAPTRPLK